MKNNFDPTRELNRRENIEAKTKLAQKPTVEKNGNFVDARPAKESFLEKLSSPDTLGVTEIDIPFERSKDLPRPTDWD